MYVDHESEFSSEQRVCNAGATEASTNSIKVGANAGRGEPVEFLFTVTEAFAGTATTLTTTLQQSSDDAGADPYANIAGISTGAIAKALLVPGYQFVLRLPDTHEAYVQAMYTGDNTFETTGKMTCHKVVDRQTNRIVGT
jgi:hypothetical protein